VDGFVDLADGGSVGLAGLAAAEHDDVAGRGGDELGLEGIGCEADGGAGRFADGGRLRWRGGCGGLVNLVGLRRGDEERNGVGCAGEAGGLFGRWFGRRVGGGRVTLAGWDLPGGSVG
jgi:hypothetical protein